MYSVNRLENAGLYSTEPQLRVLKEQTIFPICRWASPYEKKYSEKKVVSSCRQTHGVWDPEALPVYLTKEEKDQKKI